MQIDLKKPATQRLVLTVLLGVGAAAVFFATHLLPFGFLNGRERIATLRAEYDRKATELSRARATVADLPRFEAEYASMHNRWTHASELLPVERGLPVLMRRVLLAAQENGVALTTFRPEDAKAEQQYTETPISLQIAGDYHQIGSFLADLANMRRILTVSDLHLSANTKNADAQGSTAADLRVSAYHLNTGGAAAPPKPEDKSEKKGGAHGDS